jgi:integrase
MSTENPHPATVPDSSVIISAARQLLEQLPPSNASTATKKAYKRELHRLITNSKARTPDQLWAAICTTQSKRTYYRRVAAVTHGLRNMIEEALEQERIGILEFSIGMHARLLEDKGVCPIADPKPRHSKRQDLRGLPVDWRESLLSALSESQFRCAYLVSAVSGCRPAELEAGVAVAISGTSLTVRIKGAKVKNTQGQPWREITYEIDSDAHELVQALYKEIARNAPIHAGFGELEVKVENKAGFTSAIRRAGRHIWPKRRSEITPYCLRHAAASDWKAGLSADEVSAALGHLSPDTKRLYGQSQMSKAGGLRPVAVQADRQVKAAAKNLVVKRSQKRPPR